MKRKIVDQPMKRLQFVLSLIALLASFFVPATFGAQTTYVLSPVAKQQFFSSNGVPLSNGFICTYAAGTVTPLVTYKDSTGVPNQNPVLLDAGGFANIWLPVGIFYKYIAYSSGTCSSGVLQWSVDQISAATGGGGGSSCGSGTTGTLMMFTSTTTCGNSTELDQNSTFVSQAVQGVAAVQGVFNNGTGLPQFVDFSTPNEGSTGTIRYYLAKVVSGSAIKATTTDTAITLYAVADTVTSNGAAMCAAGTTGQACLQVLQGGKAILTADSGGVAANHYFGESTATDATIMDLGASPNTPGCLGVADSGAVTASSTGTVRMGSCGAISGAISGGCTIGPYLAIPYYSVNPTGTVCSPSDQIFAGIDPNGPSSTIDMLGVGTTSPDSTLEVDAQHPVDSSGGGTDATDVLNIQGGKGGNTTGVSVQTAGHGSEINVLAGDGGDAPSGSTNGDGGSIFIASGVPGSGIGNPGNYAIMYLQNESAEPTYTYRGPILIGLGDCSSIGSPSADFCIHYQSPLIHDVASGNGAPGNFIQIYASVGQETSGTAVNAGNGGNVELLAGGGGKASTGSANGNGGDIVIDTGTPGAGTGAAGVSGTLQLNPSGGPITVNGIPTITASGSSCAITAITNGLITGATCTP